MQSVNGLEEFANQIKRRRGRLSQADLSVISGVSKRLIERLESKKGEAPKIGRYEAIDLSSAVNWPPDDALAVLRRGDPDNPKYRPLDEHDRAYLETGAPRRRLDRIWPHLSRGQQRALVGLVAAMFAEHAPEPDRDPRPTGHPGLRIEPREHPPLPGQRDNDVEEPSTGE